MEKLKFNFTPTTSGARFAAMQGKRNNKTLLQEICEHLNRFSAPVIIFSLEDDNIIGQEYNTKGKLRDSNYWDITYFKINSSGSYTVIIVADPENQIF